LCCRWQRLHQSAPLLPPAAATLLLLLLLLVLGQLMAFVQEASAVVRCLQLLLLTRFLYQWLVGPSAVLLLLQRDQAQALLH
jgi:hypothetical protein